MYTVTSAQLPEPPEGADRIFVAPNAVIVLDGASAFASGSADASKYVDTLGEHLRAAIVGYPKADLSDLLAQAIESTADALSLRPGHSPTSTVASARWSESTVDLLVLGDSQIATPHGLLRDDRLDTIASAERTAYRDRLRAGHGYDDRHRDLLAQLQAEQARHRNQRGGYWIAEADPLAAPHAITMSLPCSALPWLVLATDGAYRLLDHLGIHVEDATTASQLADCLARCESWEANSDCNGTRLPRSKRHDDKSIALLRRNDEGATNH